MPPLESLRSPTTGRLRRAGGGTLALFLALVMAGFLLQLFSGSISWGGYLTCVGFYCLMFFLGVYAARRDEQHVEELLLAGRQLPLGVALLSMTATWVGGGFINGTAESVSSSGLAWAQAPWGYALSLIVGGLLFARPMRRHGFTTMLDPLEDRYGKRVAGVLYLPALLGEVFWTAAILTALGTTFGLILNIDYTWSILISAIIAIAYTSLGGMRAVAMTDVFQLGILILGLYLALPFITPDEGWHTLWPKYRAEYGELALPWATPAWGQEFFLWCDYALLLIFGGIPWHVYFQRVLSSKTERTAQWLSIGAGGLCLVASFPAMLIGMVAATTDWSALEVGGPPTAAVSLPYVLKHLAPPLVAAIGLGALAAAVVSSVDSSILSASSMGAWNVYRPLRGDTVQPQELNRVVRRLIWIVGIAATLMALQLESVYALWFLCSDFVYCLLFPQLLTALFDRRANTFGSVAGFTIALLLRLGGGEPALGLPQWLPYPMTGEDGTIYFPFRTLSMLAGLVTIIVVSRLTTRWQAPTPLRKRQS